MIKIGSRGSKLALWQANWTKQTLETLFPDLEVTIQIIKTTGDRYQEVAPPSVMPKGLFTKEIQDAVLQGEVDLAVHSLKDLPTELHPDLDLVAITERATPFDALISRSGQQFNELPSGAKIGTGSTRRRSQLLNARPDVTFHDLRGNVDTRLRKLDEGEYDAIILASAGLTRLGLKDRITQILPPSLLLPAVGQGALGMEIRANDEATAKYVSALNHLETRAACLAERAFLTTLGGGCLVPIAAFAEVKGAQLSLQGCVASLDGQQVVKDIIAGNVSDNEQLGRELADRVLKAGADKLMSALKDHTH